MERNLIFKDGGIIFGEDMRDILKIFPKLEPSFKQRKSYDEYYYTETKVEIENLEIIEKINEDFNISLSSSEIVLS